MTRKSFLTLAAIVVMAMAAMSCTKPDTQPGPDEQEEQKKPEKLKDFEVTVPVTDNWVYEDRPNIVLEVKNPNSVVATAEATVQIYTDKNKSIVTISNSDEVPANGTRQIALTTDEDLAPGFYKARCMVGKKVVRTFVFGISPYEIVSAPDMQPDFDEFWQTAKDHLPKLVEGETFTMTEVMAKSGARKVYLVEMRSVPNGLEGDPVIVRGFYVEPQDGQKHPVLMHFFGWDDRSGSVTVPSGGSGNYAEFYLSTRGQYHNNRPAAHDKDTWVSADPCTYASILNPNDKYNWFGFNFGDKDSFYYRGAFMDCVQAVRFMATRETSDMNNLFAEGSSQGGALSYAAAALSDYPFTALAANVAFLGDYPDYFDIVSWPGNVAKANQGSMTDEEMYAFLSYFDTKNLATRISCAVLASSGLQDGTCPPHTNFAPFNNLNTEDKEMVVAPKMQHDYPTGWNTKWSNFFKERMK